MLVRLLTLVAFGALLETASAQRAAAVTSLVLTNAAQARALTRAEAEKKIPIRVRGVVLESGASKFSLIDGTVGLFVAGSPAVVNRVRRGDLVEVEGVSNPGEFAPYLEAKVVRKLGTGQVPTPPSADLDALLSGRLDAQWIEVSGVVRRVEQGRRDLYMEVNLEPGGGRVLARANAAERSVTVDCTIRLRAVCYYQFNRNRQVLRPFLSVPPGELLVTEPASTNLEAMAVCPVESLLQFGVDRSYMHRVRVRGVAIHAQPGEGLWIRDAGHALRVSCEAKEPVKVGAEVEVFGFVKREEYGPVLEDAIFRQTGKSQPVAPTHLTKAAEAFDHDADLVECEAVIRETWQTVDGIRLKLADEATEFPCVLRLTERHVAPKTWLPGARVRVAGVCAVGGLRSLSGAGRLEPQFFQILLRSAEDVVVLRSPPWWTPEHRAWVVASVFGALMVLGGGVAWVHRRRATRLMAQMRARAALAEERSRIARDLHDELGAGLTRIGWLSGLVAADQGLSGSAATHSAKLAQQARQMVESMDEIVWAVNPHKDTLDSLAQYLTHYAHECFASTPIQCRLNIPSGLPAMELPSEVRHNLFLAIKEALHNVVKHSHATQAAVSLALKDSVLVVTVEDNGKGFVPGTTPSGRQGHGLENSRHRMELLSGRYECDSAPGRGTRITLSLKLQAGQAGLVSTHQIRGIV